MSETPGQVRPAPRRDAVFSDPVLRRLSIVVILGAVMSILDTTIVNVALDTLAREFHTSISTIQWVTTGYLLALAIVIPMSGWTVERFGAKRTWITSLVLFTVGSALCGLAWSSESLIFFRVLQGVGGGMIMPVGQTIMARAAGPQRMGRVMSILGVPTLLAPIIGPVLGGLIIDNASWRWIFYVNVPIGILAIALSAVFLSPGGRTDAGRFDFVGMALLSPGLAVLVYGLSEAGGGSGFGSTTVIACMAIGVVLVAAFVLHALRVDRPLLDMHLFRDRGFAVSNVAIFIFGGALYAGMILLPLYSQVVRGDSALVAGLLLAPQGIGAMITMPYGGKLTDRIGAGTVVPIGMAVFLLGTLFFTQLGPGTSYTWICLSLFIRGHGHGVGDDAAHGRRLRQPDPHTRAPGHHHPQHHDAGRWVVRHRAGGGGAAASGDLEAAPPAEHPGLGPLLGHGEAPAGRGPAAVQFLRLHLLGGGGHDGGGAGGHAAAAQGPARPPVAPERGDVRPAVAAPLTD